jgi:hypothetical protein
MDMDMDTNMDTDIGAETEMGIDIDRALTKFCQGYLRLNSPYSTLEITYEKSQ